MPAGSSLASTPLAAKDSSLGSITANASFFSGGGLVSAVTSAASSTAHPRANTPYIGFYLGVHPLRWYDDTGYTPNGSTTAYHDLALNESAYGGSYEPTYTLACEDGNGGWIPYDNKSLSATADPNGVLNNSVSTGSNPYPSYERGFGLDCGFIPASGLYPDRYLHYYETIDPRTSRFGMLEGYIDGATQVIPPYSGYGWVDINNGVLFTDRIFSHAAASANSSNSGMVIHQTQLFSLPYTSNSNISPWFSPGSGWYHNARFYPDGLRPGLFAQNNPSFTPDGMIAPTDSSAPITSTWNATGPYTQFYYTDPDGVARRAAGGNVPASNGLSANTKVGLPSVSAVPYPAPNPAITPGGPTAAQIDSRPVVLNRPFQSVAELGYVFSGTPWKNLDFFQPESGNAALLDVFCLNDTSDANAVTAGQLNLNTRQVPVLQAVLSLTNKDLWNASATAVGSTPANAAYTLPGGSAAQAQTVAQLLVTRTANGPATGPNSNAPQPLQNLSDLIGRWVAPVQAAVQNSSMSTNTTGGIDGLASCDGFTRDLATSAVAVSPDPTHNIQRYEEAAVRSLANVGQTRVWNLMIDIVAQAGRYPAQTTSLDQFVVEGEQHYWVHLAIDRCTGQVIDKQVEIVKE